MARNTNNALGYKYITSNKKNSHYKMQSLVGKQHSTGMFHPECHTHNKSYDKERLERCWGVGMEGG